MHAKFLVTLFALSVCTAPLAAQEPTQEPDTPPEPPAVARACIHRVERITRTAVRRARHRTTQCVKKINRLLEHDEVEGAAKVAEYCANAVNESSAIGVEKAVGVGEECAQTLQALGAPEGLIEGVQRHVMRGIHIIQTVRERLIGRLREAIGHTDDGDAEP